MRFHISLTTALLVAAILIVSSLAMAQRDEVLGADVTQCAQVIDACGGNHLCMAPASYRPVSCDDPTCNRGPCLQQVVDRDIGKCFYDTTVCADGVCSPGALLTVSCDDPRCNKGACEVVVPQEELAGCGGDDCDFDEAQDSTVDQAPEAAGGDSDSSGESAVTSLTRVLGKKHVKSTGLRWRAQPYMINALYRLVHDERNPTPAANHYWLSRLPDKQTIPELFGAMVWHRVHGITH